MRIPSPFEVARPLGETLLRILRLSLLTLAGLAVLLALVPIALLAAIETTRNHASSRRAAREVAAMGDRPGPDAGEGS